MLRAVDLYVLLFAQHVLDMMIWKNIHFRPMSKMIFLRPMSIYLGTNYQRPSWNGRLFWNWRQWTSTARSWAGNMEPAGWRGRSARRSWLKRKRQRMLVFHQRIDFVLTQKIFTKISLFFVKYRSFRTTLRVFTREGRHSVTRLSPASALIVDTR